MAQRRAFYFPKGKGPSSPGTTALGEIFRICRGNEAQKRWGQTKDLIVAARRGSSKARDEVILANLGLVVKIATRYMKKEGTIPLEDLIGYGIEGLIVAVGKFNIGYETKFSTYAGFWIQQAITRSIMDKERTIRIPVHKEVAIGQQKREAAQKGVSHQETQEELLLEVSSFNICRNNQDGDELIDFIPSGGRSPEENVASLQFMELLKSRLSEREWIVLSSFSSHKDSIAQIGRELGLSRGHTWQIKTRAVKKARKILKAHGVGPS